MDDADPIILYREDGTAVATCWVDMYVDDYGPDTPAYCRDVGVETPEGVSGLSAVHGREGVFKVVLTGELLYEEPPQANSQP